MSVALVAEIVGLPDADGWGKVILGGVERRCYFEPRRLVFPAPTIGARVFVAPGAAGTIVALWLV